MSSLPPYTQVELNYQTPSPYGNSPTLVRLAGIFTLVAAGFDLLHAALSTAMLLFMLYALTGIAAAAAAGAPAPPPGAAATAMGLPPATTGAGLPPTTTVGPEVPAPATAVGTAPAAPAGAFVPGPAGPVPAGPPVPFPFPRWQMILMYGVPGALSLLTCIFKIIAGIKILRMRGRARGWGLAAGIVGCCELWMFVGCCFMFLGSLAAGVFTIVVMCFAQVRLYMRDRANTSLAAS